MGQSSNTNKVTWEWIRGDDRDMRTVERLNQNRDDIFKMKFGAEVEFESNEYYEKSYLDRLLKGNNVRIQNVINDGSLSNNGFEVLIEPQNSLDELLIQLDGIREVLDKTYVSYKAGSPCAIHIHMSNYPKPTHLFLYHTLIHNILKHMTNAVGNQLVCRPLNLPDRDHLKEVMEDCPRNFDDFDDVDLSDFESRGFDPVYTREIWKTHGMFMGSRRSTLRFAGYDGGLETVEFRIMPNRAYSGINKIYIKSINNILKTVDGLTIDDIYDLIYEYQEKSLEELGEYFQKVTQLSNKEMYILFNKFNQDNPIPSNVDSMEIKDLINNQPLNQRLERVLDEFLHQSSDDVVSGDIDALRRIRTPMHPQQYFTSELNPEVHMECDLMEESVRASRTPQPGYRCWIPLDKILGVFNGEEYSVIVFQDFDGLISRTTFPGNPVDAFSEEINKYPNLKALFMSNVGWTFQHILTQTPINIRNLEPLMEERVPEWVTVTNDHLDQSLEELVNGLEDPQQNLTHHHEIQHGGSQGPLMKYQYGNLTSRGVYISFDGEVEGMYIPSNPIDEHIGVAHRWDNTYYSLNGQDGVPFHIPLTLIRGITKYAGERRIYYKHPITNDGRATMVSNTHFNSWVRMLASINTDIAHFVNEYNAVRFKRDFEAFLNGL